MAEYDQYKEKKLVYYHDAHPDITADQITERVTAFATTDGDHRPDCTAQSWIVPEGYTFEEYKEKLKAGIMMKRENGILEARLHTAGDSCWWGTSPHAHIHSFFQWAGADRDNDIIIFGGTGKDFFGGYGTNHSDTTRDPSLGPFIPHPVHQDPWMLMEHQYWDGTHDIEAQVFGVDVPTIGVWNGGAFHTDIPLLTDITLATEDAWTTEMHFRVNMMPGDGIQTVWRELMGRKRFAYAELTGQIITARQALEWGMINEILPDTESAYRRAHEIADLIMHSGSRLTRRLTTQQLRLKWKQDFAQELRTGFSTEMYCTLAVDSPHSGVYWEGAVAEAKAVLAAEKKGKVVKPRIGPFIEEDIIK